MIDIRNISYSYKEKLVLANINISIDRGEHVSILGKSGCGKTTLVNILAGYLPLKEGEIAINGKILSKPGKDRIVVSQENDLFDWLTAWQNMALVSNDDNKIRYYLSLVELLSAKDYYPNRLSGGMKKRLSLARALVVEPSFLILDEPFASLDHRTRDSILVELNKIHLKTHKTILQVTHNVDEAIFLSDRIIVLGGHPTKVSKEIMIDFPHPRTQKIKTSNAFKRYKHLLLESYL